MVDQLSVITGQFHSAQARLGRLIEHMPEERWARRNNPTRWSVCECVVHINLTSEAFFPVLRSALDEARRLNLPPRSRHRRDFTGWMLSIALGPLPRMGPFRLGAVRTARAFVPTSLPPRAEAMESFDSHQDALLVIVREGGGLPIDRVWITSPFHARIRYSLYSALVMLPRHQIRHIIQAEQVWR